MPNFTFHIRHGIHSSDHNMDLPDARAAHQEATIIFEIWPGTLPLN
jgi:hypothetical protein